MLLDSGTCFGFWEVFLDSGTCFRFWHVFWILESVFGFWEVFFDSGTCFGFWEVFWILAGAHQWAPDSGKCFGILGRVFGFWDVFWILGSVFGFWDVFCPYEPPYSSPTNGLVFQRLLSKQQGSTLYQIKLYHLNERQ